MGGYDLQHEEPDRQATLPAEGLPEAFMFVSRQRRNRRDLVWPPAALTGIPAITLLATMPAASSSVLGLPVGKNGLLTTWAGEALTVALAFALPAVLAGMFVGVRRAGQRLGTRGIVLVAAAMLVAGLGAVAVDQQPELITRFAAWAGIRL